MSRHAADAECICGHTRQEHTVNTTACIACLKCDRPERTPHAADTCPCNEFRPADPCDVCGTGLPPDSTVCRDCAPVVTR